MNPSPSLSATLLDCLDLAERLVPDHWDHPSQLEPLYQLQLRILYLLRNLCPEQYLNRHLVRAQYLTRFLRSRNRVQLPYQ